MAEISTAAAATAAAGITLAGVSTGIDAPTLMGALSGASVFVLSAKDLGQLTRFIYLIISVVMGYLGGPSVLSHIFIEPALCAFVFSSVVVGLALKLISSTDKIDVNNWLKPRG